MHKESEIIVSIVMPIYNASCFLEDSVLDILGQTVSDFELICVNDGSSDNSGELLDAFAREDKRIRVIHQKNAGGGAARNAGMKLARGKYLLFLDADDRFEPNMLETIYNEAERTACDILTFGADTFDHITGNRGSAPWLINGSKSEINGNPFEIVNTTVWNKLFKKEYIEFLDIHFQDNRIVDTMSFVATALLGMEKGTVVPNILLHYRINNVNSIIANPDKYPLEIYLALRAIYSEINKREYLKKNLPYYYSFAVENIRIRLDMLKECATFNELYTCLHEGGLDEIGLTCDIDDSHRYKDWDYIQRIRKYNAEEFLFYRMKYLRAAGFTDVTSFDIPENLLDICKGHTILVHGGGMVGRGYVRRLMKLGIDISAWSDGNVKEQGYPITTINEAISKPFDFVLLAVESDKTAEYMRRDFYAVCVDPDKILWEPPIRI